jgi:membrane protease YdiL (CAAX protease family)
MRPSKTPSPLEVLFLIGGVVAAQILIGPLLLYTMGQIAGTIAAQFLLLLTPALLFLLGGGFDLRVSLPLRPPSPRGAMLGVLIGLALWLPALLTAAMVSSWLPKENLTEVSEQIGGLVQKTYAQIGWMGTLLAFAAVPGVAEEFLLRGVVLPAFLRKFPWWMALFCSAFIFALLHGNIPQGAATLAIGYLLGVIVMRSGSLWIAMIAHAVHNSIILLVTLFVTPSLDLSTAESVPSIILWLPVLALMALWFGFLWLPRQPQWWIVEEPLPTIDDTPNQKNDLTSSL